MILSAWYRLYTEYRGPSTQEYLTRLYYLTRQRQNSFVLKNDPEESMISESPERISETK